MSLLNSIVGGALKNMAGGKQQQSGGINPALIAALAPVVLKMLSNNGQQGGLNGLVGMFAKQGLGNVIQSWIGNGPSLPVSGEQITNVFGSDLIGSIAKQAGLGNNDVSGGLASLLPMAIDHLTPKGEAPSGGLGSSDELMGMLGGLMGGGKDAGGLGNLVGGLASQFLKK